MVAKANRANDVRKQQRIESAEAGSQKSWTVMVYLAADNNLANFGIESLKQMKLAANKKFNIVAEFDCGPAEPTTRYAFDGTNPYGSIGDNEVGQGAAINAGDPRNLSDFIIWAQNQYKADHYFLIIWGHASGIDDSFPRTPDNAAYSVTDLDESFVPRHRLLSLGSMPIPAPKFKSLAFVDHPSSYLTNQGLRSALEVSQNAQSHDTQNGNPVKKLDLIGFDACNMALIELAYELRGIADYMIASQDSVPDASWPYGDILQELAENPDMSPHDLAAKVAESYVNAYQDYVNQPVALSVLKLNGLSTLIPKLKSKLKPILHSVFKKTQMYKAIVQARSRVRSFYTHELTPPDWYSYDLYVDLLNFLELLENSAMAAPTQAEIKEIRNDLREIIVSNKASWNQLDCNGISIYFPVHPNHAIAELYDNLDFSRDTGWAAFLRDFSVYNPYLPEQIGMLRTAMGLKGNPNDGPKNHVAIPAVAVPGRCECCPKMRVMQGRSF